MCPVGEISPPYACRRVLLMSRPCLDEPFVSLAIMVIGIFFAFRAIPQYSSSTCLWAQPPDPTVWYGVKWWPDIATCLRSWTANLTGIPITPSDHC